MCIFDVLSFFYVSLFLPRIYHTILKLSRQGSSRSQQPVRCLLSVMSQNRVKANRDRNGVPSRFVLGRGGWDFPHFARYSLNGLRCFHMHSKHTLRWQRHFTLLAHILSGTLLNLSVCMCSFQKNTITT